MQWWSQRHSSSGTGIGNDGVNGRGVSSSVDINSDASTNIGGNTVCNYDMDTDNNGSISGAHSNDIGGGVSDYDSDAGVSGGIGVSDINENGCATTVIVVPVVMPMPSSVCTVVVVGVEMMFVQ